MMAAQIKHPPPHRKVPPLDPNSKVIPLGKAEFVAANTGTRIVTETLRVAGSFVEFYVKSLQHDLDDEEKRAFERFLKLYGIFESQVGDLSTSGLYVSDQDGNVEFDFFEDIQQRMRRLVLNQKKKRHWFLHIRVKNRKRRHRGPRSDFDYRRLPVR